VPLQVLRRFLSVLGSFDWEHYCLTLQGPLPIATLQQHGGSAAAHTTVGLCHHSCMLCAAAWVLCQLQ
jgi:hypothetical protein